MDYLEELANKTNGQIKKQDHLSSNFAKKSFRALLIKDFNQFKVQINDYDNMCSINIKANSEISFSINNPDKVLFYSNRIFPKSFPYPVYVSDSDSSLIDNKHFIKAYNSISSLLKKMDLTPEESVFVYTNAVCFALKTDRNLLPILDDIIKLLHKNQEIFKRIVRKVMLSKNIPEHLRPLIPLLKKYSISDDAERAQLAEEIKESKKKKLIAAVDPYMAGINNFLDSFQGQPLTEEATLLGNLAELVSELKINLLSSK